MGTPKRTNNVTTTPGTRCIKTRRRAGRTAAAAILFSRHSCGPAKRIGGTTGRYRFGFIFIARRLSRRPCTLGRTFVVNYKGIIIEKKKKNRKKKKKKEKGNSSVMKSKFLRK